VRILGYEVREDPRQLSPGDFGVSNVRQPLGNEVNSSDADRAAVASRSGRAWFALGLRVVAVAGFATAFVFQGAWRWGPMAIAEAIVVLLVSKRNRTSSTLGALWIGSANLLSQGRKHSGQLALTADSIIWTPSSASTRRGVAELNLSISDVSLESGRALFDVVSVRPAIGYESRFRTRKDPTLSPSIQALRASSSQL